MNLITELKRRLDEAELWEHEHVLKRNEYLKVRGEIDSRLYYIVDGSMRAFIDFDEEEHTIRLGYRDNFIAALDSFITGKPSELYIQALKKTHLLSLSRPRYQAFLHSNPENLQLWQQMTEMLVVQQLEREQDLIIRSPRERYERVQERSPQVFEEIPLRYIASYLRMTPETLSRLRKS